jgi:flagellar biosynthetic protein FliR
VVVDLDAAVQSVNAFTWPFLRTSALLYAAPVFGNRTLPATVRVLLAVFLALLVAPLVPPPPAVDPLTFAGLVIGAQQLVIGLAMGFVLTMVFSVLAQAGEQVALGMGLGFASINDPSNGLTVPVVSQYYVIVGTLVFLGLGGHVLIIETLARSFVTLPVGLDGLDADVFYRIALWGAQMFAAAVLLALPAVASLLVVNLAFGVVTRAAPQLNIFAVGFPIMILVGIGAMLFTLPALTDQLADVLAAAFGFLGRMIGA